MIKDATVFYGGHRSDGIEGMKVGPLFKKIRETSEKFIVLQGGGDAGKTIAALQAIASWSSENPNFISTIVGQDVPNIKGGSLRGFKRYVVTDSGMRSQIAEYNNTERRYTFRNKSIIEFKSFSDEQDARGGEREILFINEANFISYQMFWQLQRKTRFKVIVDYNPTSYFWVHDKLMPGATQERQFEGKVRRYITDHRHNPFLPEDEHEAYESIGDPDLFRVYSRGMTGKIRGLIYGHFKKCELPPEKYDRIIYGIDYGYTNDPTALVKIWCDGRKRYAKELCYRPGIAAKEIKAILLQDGYNTGDVIYSEIDSDMINQLRILGLPVIPAIKSVAAGLSKTREYECFYFDSPNFEKEILFYKWVTAQDLFTGREVMTNIPVDEWNHCCDAFRYAIYTDSFRSPEPT